MFSEVPLTAFRLAIRLT